MDVMNEATKDVCFLGQCQLGVLPLGTGNDLARVLGWGPSCDDDTQLPQILEKLERASTKMLDRYKHITSIKQPKSQKTKIIIIFININYNYNYKS